jgi:hypothetical protein
LTSTTPNPGNRLAEIRTAPAAEALEALVAAEVDVEDLVELPQPTASSATANPASLPGTFVTENHHSSVSVDDTKLLHRI